jgi:hypothetical protein
VCQKLPGLPSTALVAAPFSPLTSTLSALTFQAARGRSCPMSPSRLISAAEVQGLPLTSESACSITWRAVSPVGGAVPSTVQVNCVAMVCAPSDTRASTR